MAASGTVDRVFGSPGRVTARQLSRVDFELNISSPVEFFAGKKLNELIQFYSFSKPPLPDITKVVGECRGAELCSSIFASSYP